MSELLYKEEVFQLVGLCMEIHHEGIERLGQLVQIREIRVRCCREFVKLVSA